MVQAIRTISIAKGADPRQYLLVAFGGAAGQHACAVARELGIRQVLCSPDAGVLSAYGIGMADVVRHRVAGVYQPYSEAALADLETVFQRLAGEACDEVVRGRFRPASGRGPPPPGPPLPGIRLLSDDSRARGRQLCARPTLPSTRNCTDTCMKAGHWRLSRRGSRPSPAQVANSPPSRPAAPRAAAPMRTVETWFDAQPHPTGVFVRDAIRPGDVLRGPAILCEPTSTTVIDPGWQGEVLSGGDLLLTDYPSALPQLSTSRQTGCRVARKRRPNPTP